MEYQKITPENSLKHAIEAYWFYWTDNPVMISDYFFPNGRPAIVFHFQKSFSYRNLNDQIEVMPAISFITCATTPVCVCSGGKTDTVAIILDPASVYNIYGLKITSDTLLIDAQPYIPDTLFMELKNSPTPVQRATILNTYFASKLKNYSPDKDLFKKICTCIINKKGMVERRSIAKDFGISENYIHKLFIQRIGLSFKPYTQLIRISNIILEVYQNNSHDWFEILEKYNYHDQSHFIKDFKKITGQTPLQYYKNDKKIMAIFSAIA